ncbi:MAG TPA: hypothetical protein VJO53_00600 [Candidatus Acidoferrales bacterium]|nr:hypothetical protein [Candidatus Acidoferrales bacterium]
MSNGRIWISVLACTALLPALNATAGATTFASMSLAQLSQTAQFIVRAKCLENTTGWDSGEIWTLTSFEVEESWRGAAPERVSVRLLGGRIGSLTSRVSGVPRFRPGEETVLFLESTPRGEFTIVSWEQGTFRIRLKTGAHQQGVTQDTATIPAFNPATRRFEAAGIREVPLDVFRAAVDAALRSEPWRKQ